MAIHVENITPSLSSDQLGRQQADTDLGQNSFFQSVQARYLTPARAAPEAGVAGSTAGISMDAYKQYIYGQISQLPMHPTQQMGSHSILISEDGFEEMKRSPEYERWVLMDIRSRFAAVDPQADVSGGSYSIYYYGASKEEAQSCRWNAGDTGGSRGSLFERESEPSFWEHRSEIHKKYLKFALEQAQKRQFFRLQQIRFELLYPDRPKKADYLAGVPASFLLSALL